ncbi:MAG TPA: hypothetical protein VJK50_01965, partial [Patescibacteria group bacterium]|nr:hypothetical protein [Patescibacteria group bacterium]
MEPITSVVGIWIAAFTIRIKQVTESVTRRAGFLLAHNPRVVLFQVLPFLVVHLNLPPYDQCRIALKWENV